MVFVPQRMLIWRGDFILCAVLICGSQTSPLKAAGAFSGASYDVSTVEQGWQPSTVTALAQTHDGYLWVGTYNGLLRYDGARFRTIDSGNSGLRNGRITSLYEDAGGVLWIGHETGELSRFADGEFQPVSVPKAWPGGAIEGICADENRDVWLIAGNGLLYRLRDGQTVESPGGGSATRKTLLLRANRGQLWISANGQVATLERGKANAFRFQGTAETDFYQAVIPSREGGAWAVINGDLRKFYEGRWEPELTNFPGAQTPITSVLETRRGAVLAGTLNEGLFMFTHGMPPLHFSRTNGLSHDWIRCLCQDHEGNICVGTGAGLDMLRAQKVRMLSPPDHWQGRAVLSFAVRSDGSAWIGTEGAGLYRYQDEHWTPYNESNGLLNLFVWSVLATQRGELLVGTWGGGLFFKNGDRFEPEGELTKDAAAVLALFESSHGELWVGTTAGLYRYENGKRAWFAGKNELVLPDVRAITETRDGTIWFGMVGGGLGSFKDGQLRQFLKKDGFRVIRFPNHEINSGFNDVLDAIARHLRA